MFAGAVTGEPRPPDELEGALLPDPGLPEVGRLGTLAELELATGMPVGWRGVLSSGSGACLDGGWLRRPLALLTRGDLARIVICIKRMKINLKANVSEDQHVLWQLMEKSCLSIKVPG